MSSICTVCDNSKFIGSYPCTHCLNNETFIPPDVSPLIPEVETTSWWMHLPWDLAIPHGPIMVHPPYSERPHVVICSNKE
jgi:hypothetical protein